MSETNVAVKDPEAPVVEEMIADPPANTTNSDGVDPTANTTNSAVVTDDSADTTNSDPPADTADTADTTNGNVDDASAGETNNMIEQEENKPKSEIVDAPGAKRSIRILKDGDEKADGEKIYTVIGDDVKDYDGNYVTDEDLKKEILAMVNSTMGGSRRSRRSRRNRRNGHRQSKKRQQKRQSKKQKQNGGKCKHQSKRNHKK